MRPTSSALRFHKVILLLLQILYKERTNMQAKNQEVTEEKEKKQHQQAESGDRTVKLIL